MSGHRRVDIILGHLVERGLDISRVKEMARPEAELRKAVVVLHFPYIRRRDAR